jgi:hypothetical protein
MKHRRRPREVQQVACVEHKHSDTLETRFHLTDPVPETEGTYDEFNRLPKPSGAWVSCH